MKRRIGAIAILVLCGLIAWVESHHWIPAYRAWTFGFVFLLIAVGAALVHGRWRDLMLVCAALAFGLCVLESAAGLIQPKPDLKISPFWIEPKPVVGFAFNHAGVIHARKRDPKTGAGIFEADYTIGPTFDRVVRNAAEGPTVVFFGDSYTFGDGLNDADTLPQRFADLASGKWRILNLAVPGHSPQQFLRQVQTGLKDDVIGPKPALFVYLTSPFHAMRTGCKENWVNRAPRFALVDDQVVFEGQCYEGLALGFHEFLENTALYRVAIRPFVVRLTHADIDLYIRTLAEAVRVSKAKYDVDTLVPFVRVSAEYLAGTGYDNDEIIAALKARGVWVVDMTLQDDPSKGLVYSIKGDGHPAPEANIVRARMIAEAFGK